MSTILIKYLDKLNNIKNRYSIPYTQKNMKEEHYVELMYEELSIEMIKEIERLNNKLKDIKSQLDYLETYSSKEDVFEDMKRRLDRIDKIIGSDKE